MNLIGHILSYESKAMPIPNPLSFVLLSCVLIYNFLSNILRLSIIISSSQDFQLLPFQESTLSSTEM